MSVKICICAKTLHYVEGGGHLWVYLNWALGLRDSGCDVLWLEGIDADIPNHEVRANIDALKNRLRGYDLDKSLALFSWSGRPLTFSLMEGCLDLSEACEADLLLNLAGGIPAEVVKRFKRSALVDIDPGLFQIWMSKGQISVARHDMYFTIGETVGRSGASFADCGLNWQYTPPCIALDWWPKCSSPAGAPFTTVSNWYTDEWIEDSNGWYRNDKRSGFFPLLDLPGKTVQPLELALHLADDEEEDRAMLQKHGWSVRDSRTVTSTPQDYQRYIQDSLGEFSCVKPSCVRLQNAWISDRTLCYLASGKPAVVQHTGTSRFLPDSSGLFRFRNIKEAASCLDKAAADYERQCRLARVLAEEYFDASKVVKRVLEQALI